MREFSLGVLECSAMASVVIVAAMVLRAILARRLPPAAMLALWALALARLLLPVALPSPVHVDSLIPRPAAVMATGAPMPFERGPQPVSPFVVGEPHSVAPAQPLQQTDDAESAEPAAAPSAPWSQRVDPWALGLALWALGAAGVLLVALVQARKLSRLVRLCQPVADGALLREVDALREELAIRTPVRALRCGWAATPMVYGVRRPALLLPPAYLSMHGDALSGVLLHELAHIRRHDILLGRLWLLARAAHWFNPLVHVAHRLYRDDVELARDALATARLSGPARLLYGEALLAAARAQRRAGNPAPAAALLGGSGLGSRVRLVLAPRRPSRFGTAVYAVLAVVLVVGCFTTACQPTPARPAVVQKNIDQMEQLAVGTAATTTAMGNTNSPESSTDATGGADAAALKAQLQVPDRLTKEFTDGSGRLTATINAKIILPDSLKLPTAKMDISVFTQEQVDKMVAVLFQGRPVYDADIAMQQTKKDIWEQLEKLYEMRDGKRKVEVDGPLEENIEVCEKAYNEAPDEIEMTPANTKLHPMDISKFHSTFTLKPWDYVEGISMLNDLPVFFRVQNKTQTGLVDALFVNRQDTDLYRMPLYIPLSTQPGKDILQGNDVKPEITPERAQEITDDIVERLGIIDMACAAVEPAVDGQRGMVSPYYIARYTGVVNGVAVTLTNSSGGSPKDMDTASDVNPGWRNEELSIVVGAQGVVEFQWISPYSEPKLVTADTQMLPFVEILECMERMLPAKYTHVEEGTEMRVTVDAVQLGLMRITDPRERSAGMLVPVWDFFGTDTLYRKDGSNTAYEGKRDSLLTINAIDGSVINRDLGY